VAKRCAFLFRRICSDNQNHAGKAAQDFPSLDEKEEKRHSRAALLTMTINSTGKIRKQKRAYFMATKKKDENAKVSAGGKAANPVAASIASSCAAEAEKALITKISPAGGEDAITGESLMASAGFNPLPSGSRFTKIKINGTGVTLQLEEVMDENNSRDVAFKSADTPHKDFTDAMDAVAKLARKILALPETYARNSFHVGGISISYSKDDVKGVVISGWINLETANSPFFFNTPHLPYAAPSEGSTVPVVPTEGLLTLNWLEHEAAQYLNGKRAQLDMFNESEAA
jgi:hypothetical protein